MLYIALHNVPFINIYSNCLLYNPAIIYYIFVKLVILLYKITNSKTTKGF